jgi:hypothetical protein
MGLLIVVIISTSLFWLSIKFTNWMCDSGTGERIDSRTSKQEIPIGDQDIFLGEDGRFYFLVEPTKKANHE